MNWTSTADFWAMGGYAFYVWGSYAALAVVVVTEVFSLRARRRKALAALKHQTAAKVNRATE